MAREHAPISRFATPEELASFVVFLCSERASYSTGSTYFVDGGMLKDGLTEQEKVEPGELLEAPVGGYTRKPARRLAPCVRMLRPDVVPRPVIYHRVSVAPKRGRIDQRTGVFT